MNNAIKICMNVEGQFNFQIAGSILKHFSVPTLKLKILQNRFSKGDDTAGRCVKSRFCFLSVWFELGFNSSEQGDFYLFIFFNSHFKLESNIVAIDYMVKGVSFNERYICWCENLYQNKRLKGGDKFLVESDSKRHIWLTSLKSMMLMTMMPSCHGILSKWTEEPFFTTSTCFEKLP